MLKFTKIRDVKTPVRGTSEAAGIDIFVPNTWDEDFKENLIQWGNSYYSREETAHGRYVMGDNNKIEIRPHERILIPMGIKVTMDKGTVLIGHNKSGISIKNGLILGPCVIDSDYTGEVMVGLINTSSEAQYITPGMKITQLLHQNVLLDNFEEVSNDEYNELTSNSERGEGGFGSTGLQ